MQTNTQAKDVQVDLEQRVGSLEKRTEKTSMLKKVGEAISYGIRRYAALAAFGTALTVGGSAVGGCGGDEESECCLELECGYNCVDTTSYKDFCVKDKNGNIAGCCHCETFSYDHEPSY